jgi:hypothetical protein
MDQDWPEIMKEDLSDDLLPRFSDEEKALIKGTGDFFAIDVSVHSPHHRGRLEVIC